MTVGGLANFAAETIATFFVGAKPVYLTALSMEE